MLQEIVEPMETVVATVLGAPCAEVTARAAEKVARVIRDGKTDVDHSYVTAVAHNQAMTHVRRAEFRARAWFEEACPGARVTTRRAAKSRARKAQEAREAQEAADIKAAVDLVLRASPRHFHRPGGRPTKADYRGALLRRLAGLCPPTGTAEATADYQRLHRALKNIAAWRGRDDAELIRRACRAALRRGGAKEGREGSC